MPAQMQIRFVLKHIYTTSYNTRFYFCMQDQHSIYGTRLKLLIFDARGGESCYFFQNKTF
jgi:hypothetical protein